MTRRAKHRLRRFSLIVPLERLGEAGPLLRAHFGWQHTNATAFRTGTRGKSLALTKMTPEMLAKLRNQTRLDHQLYDYACMLFDQQTELLAKSPSGGAAKVGRAGSDMVTPRGWKPCGELRLSMERAPSMSSHERAPSSPPMSDDGDGAKN